MMLGYVLLAVCFIVETVLFILIARDLFKGGKRNDYE
jgi:hypothetical protein